MVILKPQEVKPVIHIANYFRLSDMRCWGPRAIQDYEFIYIVGGEFSYTETDKEPLIIHEGDILCIPPGIRHTFKCGKIPVYGAVISCIHLELLKNASRNRKDYRPEKEPPRVIRVKGDYSLHQLFRNCAKLKNEVSIYKNEILETMAKEIWLRLTEYSEGGNSEAYSCRIRDMINFIESKIPEKVTRQDISKKFYLTPEHINVIFKSETGMTPTQFVHHKRIDLACRLLLEEGMSIKETAEAAGFNDEFYFSKVFKKIMNITPGSLGNN